MDISLTLNSNRNKKSVNTDNYQVIGFENSLSPIPIDNIEQIINTYKVFEDEKNKSTKYRFNITLNPIMTNILANRITEIINTNNDSIIQGDERLSLIQNIDDEKYSYHIGYDIFDNNYMRINSFKIGKSLNDFIGPELTNLSTMQKTIYDNLIEDNGWVCLSNKTKINGNKMFPNKKPCEKIDIFPTRDYFLFKPIVISGEPCYNWDISLTYPFENYYNNILVTDNNGINGMPINNSELVTYNNNNFVKIRTIYKHGLKANDIIKIKGNTPFDNKTYIVYSLGDIDRNDKEYAFLIDTSKYADLIGIKDMSTKRIVKVINGFDSKYYIRKFRKIPNFYLDDEIITNDNIDIKILTGSTNFVKDIYQPAFSKTIFDDSVYQIQYSDDVDINFLKDNLGRPITEIFVTLIKSNKYTADHEPYNIFGEVTSGINTHPEVTGFSNVRIITGSTYGEKPLESKITHTGVTINNNENINSFFGDIVEYSPFLVKEYKLDDIYHRFNTVQREQSNDFIYSDIIGDNTNIILNSAYDEPEDNLMYWGFKGIVDYSVSNGVLTVSNSGTENSGVYTSNGDQLSLIKGNTYTLSFEIRTSDSGPDYNMQIKLSGLYSDNINLQSLVNVNASFQKYAFTFEANDSSIQKLELTNISGTSRSFDLKSVKLENNITSTDWSKNPNDYNGNYVFSTKTIKMKPIKEGYFYKPHYPIQLKNYSSIINYGEIPELSVCEDKFTSGITYDGNVVILNGLDDNNVKSLILKLSNVDGLFDFIPLRITRVSDNEYINVKINKSSIFNNCIIIPYDKNFMPGVNDIYLNEFTLRIYNDDNIPYYCQDLLDGTCAWRNILKEDVYDEESVKINDFILSNGKLYVNKTFNIYLRRQDPFGYYGLRANNFPIDLRGVEIINDIVNDITKKTEEVC